MQNLQTNLNTLLICSLGVWQRFNRAYQSAVTSLQRSRGANEDAAIEEQQSSFRKCRLPSSQDFPSKKAKPSSWTQKFFCLADPSDDRVPTTSFAKKELKLAGLGEKRVVLEDVDCSTSTFTVFCASTFLS